MPDKDAALKRIKRWGMRYRAAKREGWRWEYQTWQVKITSALTILKDAELITNREGYLILKEIFNDSYDEEKEDSN